jgi:hypothetical protein
MTHGSGLGLCCTLSVALLLSPNFPSISWATRAAVHWSVRNPKSVGLRVSQPRAAGCSGARKGCAAGVGRAGQTTRKRI